MKANHICKLMVDLEMISAIRLYNGPMRYTYDCEANERFSLLDNIWINFGQNNAISVQNVDILKDEDSFRDHCSVGSTLLIKGANEPCKLNVNDCWFKYIWSENAKSKYYHETCNNLQKWLYMFNNRCLHSCDCVTCVDRSHVDTINYFYDSLVTVLVEGERLLILKNVLIILISGLLK